MEQLDFGIINNLLKRISCPARTNAIPNNQELSMLIKKEKIEDLEFMEVEPEDEELRSIVMEEEDKALS